MHNMTATVAAVSTPSGKGGVALIRVSGRDAFVIADRVFLPRCGKALSALPPRTQHFGDILSDGELVDEGLATRFPAPHSFTGEDTVEICCHGGILVTRCVLEGLFTAGAVPAAPGEFTRRAFLNGKMSLTDAEALGLLLDAGSRDQLRLSGAAARGRLSDAIRELCSSLTEILGATFARIDYPDEDLGEFSDEECAARLSALADRTERLIRTYRTGRAVCEGIRTVLVGKPNAGKSSLYNLLAGEDAAIVTAVAGTTRDVLERTVPLGRVLLRLADTAGVRETDDPVEAIGVARAKACLADADLILAVFDSSRPWETEDEALVTLIKDAGIPAIALLNKADMPIVIDKNRVYDAFSHVLSLSCTTGDTEELRALVDRMFTDGDVVIGQDAVVSSARQYATLLRVRDALREAVAAYAAGLPADAASSLAERALNALGELCGTTASEAVTAEIFSKFCVGK